MESFRLIVLWSVLFFIGITECAQKLGDCISVISQSKCAPGQYLDINQEHLRCARCRGGLGLSTGCDDSERCAPGLICDPASRTCIFDKKNCMYTHHLPASITSRPTCEADGTFTAKQCKGDMLTGRCFCYSKMGERIFGWDWQRNAGDMTCACSRRKTQIKTEGQRSTLHCAQNGNYEELQCADRICWCVDPRTGEQTHGTRAVLENSLVTLPCFDDRNMSRFYLRHCESKSEATHRMGQALERRGFQKATFEDESCGFDGNYGATSMQPGNVIACTWYDGSIFNSYRVELIRNASPMRCYCALDTKRFMAAGLQLSLTCNARGDYAAWQRTNGRSFCVDSDGFASSDLVDIEHESDCDKYLYDKLD